MKLIRLTCALTAFAAMLMWSSVSRAVSSWKISDFTGNVSVARAAGEHSSASIGTDIAPGDSITIDEGAWVELVFSGTCEVWEIGKADRYTFSEHDIVSSSAGNKIPPGDRLSVCFNSAGFSTGEAQRIGGIIERGESPEEELKETGSKSNAALINLIIIYALHDKDIEKARPFYELLKQRAPGSEFVAGISEIFERKAP